MLSAAFSVLPISLQDDKSSDFLLLVWHIFALILIILTYNANAPNTLGMRE